uniref:Uncharacterized protein n=1 Tax=Medicago truncatula TaxID=3880 RepID=I3S3W5_MEDTR|nr:unknown [Medicago truncatula]
MFDSHPLTFDFMVQPFEQMYSKLYYFLSVF